MSPVFAFGAGAAAGALLLWLVDFALVRLRQTPQRLPEPADQVRVDASGEAIRVILRNMAGASGAVAIGPRRAIALAGELIGAAQPRLG